MSGVRSWAPLLLILSWALGIGGRDAAAESRSARWPIVERRPISDSASLDGRGAGAGGCRLVIDNLEGPLTVRGLAGGERKIVWRGTETVRARSAEAVAGARRLAALRVRRLEGVVELVADGPFRCGWHGAGDGRGPRGDRWCGESRSRDWRVAYALEVEVPSRCDLELSSVEDSAIRVEGVEGRLEIAAVDGPLVLRRVSGPGHARTVNGGISVSLSEKATGPLDLETVNGDIETVFPSPPDAEFRLATMNGDLWTDFAFTPVPARPALVETGSGDGHGTRFVVRRGEATTIRIGAGGPSWRMVTLNGDVMIASGGKPSAGKPAPADRGVNDKEKR